MVKKRAGLLFVSLLCLAAVIFTSCSAGNTEPQGKETVANAVNTDYSIPQENRRAYMADIEVCPSSTSNGVYSVNTVSKSLWYYDAQAGKGTFLCAQSGCTHDDETCQAWIGDVTVFTEYHGDIFAIRQYEDESRDFIKKELSTGKIEVLKKWESFDGGYYEPVIGVISDDRVLLYLTLCSYSEESEVTQSERTCTEILYSLSTGEITEMPFDEISTDEIDFSVMGLGKDTMAVLVRGYIDNKDTEEIRLYNLDTYDYTVLADTDSGFVIPVFPNYVYNKQIVYACKGAIYLFDLSTLEERELIEAEGIVNYSIMDNKIFYTTSENGSYSFFYADIDKPISVALKNGGDATVAKFSIMCEGESFFISSNAVPKIISKEDFYAERYENAHAL